MEGQSYIADRLEIVLNDKRLHRGTGVDWMINKGRSTDQRCFVYTTHLSPRRYKDAIIPPIPPSHLNSIQSIRFQVIRSKRRLSRYTRPTILINTFVYTSHLIIHDVRISFDTYPLRPPTRSHYRYSMVQTRNAWQYDIR
jgi:hypothetical protein